MRKTLPPRFSPAAIRSLLLAGFAGFAALLLTSAVEARSMAMPQDQIVNVSVSFNSQVPIPDLSEETISSARKKASEVLYELARKECTLMQDIIADTCRLTNLNISTQIQNYNNQAPLLLYINSNANFSITLKEPGTAE